MESSIEAVTSPLDLSLEENTVAVHYAQSNNAILQRQQLLMSQQRSDPPAGQTSLLDTFSKPMVVSSLDNQHQMSQ